MFFMFIWKNSENTFMRERENSKIIRQRLQLLDRLASFKVNHESKFLTVLEMPDGLPVLYTNTTMDFREFTSFEFSTTLIYTSVSG